MGRHLIVFWGVAGVSAVLIQALVRLGPIAWEPIAGGQLSASQWVTYVGWALFNAHVEGYRGFHRMFSPRVVARAEHLARHPHPVRVALAPVFCMSLFHASRRGRTVAWSILVGVLGLIALIRHLEQSWRGIVDGGVVVGLGLGLMSLLFYYGRFLAGHPPVRDPDLP